MLTAETILGKVVIFICRKAATHILALPFDKRRRACRSLTKLYYSFQALDEASESIFRTAEDFRTTNTGEAYAVMNALNNHSRQVELASNLFFDLGIELYDGLLLIDPPLAQCCRALYVSKFDFLSEMSDSIAWDRSGARSRIIIKMPKNTVDLDLLEQSYTAATEAHRRGDIPYWPDTWTPSAEPSEIILTWEDDETARAFLHKLKQHRAVLVEAKERLRQLLKDNFSVEELLFQTDTFPYQAC